MNKSKLRTALIGAAVMAVSVIAMWQFSLPNWAAGLAMLGSIGGLSAMAMPFVAEPKGEAGQFTEPGAGTPEAHSGAVGGGHTDSGGGDSGGGGGGGE